MKRVVPLNNVKTFKLLFKCECIYFSLFFRVLSSRGHLQFSALKSVCSVEFGCRSSSL